MHNNAVNRSATSEWESMQTKCILHFYDLMHHCFVVVVVGGHGYGYVWAHSTGNKMHYKLLLLLHFALSTLRPFSLYPNTNRPTES